MVISYLDRIKRIPKYKIGKSELSLIRNRISVYSYIIVVIISWLIGLIAAATTTWTTAKFVRRKTLILIGLYVLSYTWASILIVGRFLIPFLILHPYLINYNLIKNNLVLK